MIIELNYDKAEVRALARGRWKYIFSQLTNLALEFLDGRHHPCPNCGGRDRARVLDIDTGALFCNQCFYENNGDGFAALAWLLGCSFSEAVNLVGSLLNGQPDQPQAVKRKQPAPKKPATPLSEQLQFLDLDPAKFEEWAKHKPPVTVEAMHAASARLAIWPAKAPAEYQQECIAVPSIRTSDDPSGWILYRVDGQPFPAIKDGPGERKTHLLRGSVDGWCILGGRSALEAAHTIIKVEGLPDALSIYSRLPDGYAVVTNTHGAKSAKNCPIDIFTGKRLIVIGDTDKSGVEGADSLARKITPYALEVKMIFPDGEITESGGKDIRDVMNENQLAGGNHQKSVTALIKKAEQTEPFQVPRDGPEQDDRPALEHNQPEQYESMPIECFPSVISEYAGQTAGKMGCDVSFVLLPLLCAIGSLIGNKRQLYFSPDYQVPPILWGAVVASSGTGKSPGFNAAMRPLFKLQRLIEERNREAFAQYDKDIISYEVESKEWSRKAGKSDNIPADEPEKPVQPPTKAYTIDDSTAEKTVSLLKDNLNGLLQQKDEMSGFFSDMDKYKSAKGSDVAMYLKAFDGTPIQEHRKGARVPIYISRPLIGLTGGIQPGILSQTLSNNYRQNGMLARFVFACPPDKPLPFPSVDGTPKATKQELDRLFESLCDLVPYEIREDCYIPKRIYLTDDAVSEYQRFYEQNRKEWFFKSQLERSAWSKFNQIVLRIALIFHCVDDVTSRKESHRISSDTMKNAIRLTEWFKKETVRVYRIFSSNGEAEETPEQQQYSRLIEFIRDQGGMVSVRDTQRGMSFKTADEAEKALGELVKKGVAEWVNIPTRKKNQPARGISLRQFRHLTPTPESSIITAGVTEKSQETDSQPIPALEPISEQFEQSAPDDLGDFMDFMD